MKKVILFPLKVLGFVVGYIAITLAAAFIAFPFWVRDHSHLTK